MPSVFISCVDLAVCRSISRVFAAATPTTRSNADLDDPGNNTNDAGEPIPDPASANSNSNTYVITGSLSRPSAETDSTAFENAASTLSPDGQYLFKPSDLKHRDTIAIPGLKPGWVSSVVTTSDKSILEKTLEESDIIIYDLLQAPEEANYAIEYLSSMTESFAAKNMAPKIFIGISSVMTWAKTKANEEDPDAPITEDEYRRRKAHPNFKTHINLEKIITKNHKEFLKSYVIGAGLIYHGGDSIFHHILKSAWDGDAYVPCFGDGENFMPVIHLKDLAAITLEVADNCPKASYILAINDAKLSYFEICKAISTTMGNSKVKRVEKEEALLNKSLTQMDCDMLSINLRLDSGVIKDLNVKWTYENGPLEHIQALVREYRDLRNLHPIKVMVHGPPASGKSTLAKSICDHYRLHHIKSDIVAKDAITALERRAEMPITEDNADEENADDNKAQWEDVKEQLKASNGEVSNELMLRFVTEKLNSMPCKNQGYVLEDFPRTMAEAEAVFNAAEDNEPEEGEGGRKELMPQFIFQLEATDEWIKDHIMSLPEHEVTGTKNSEEALKKRLEEFRALNTDENTVLNFFDELEIHPIVLPLEHPTNALPIGPDKNKTAPPKGSNPWDILFEAVKQRIGKPHNYGLTQEQRVEKKRVENEQKAKEAAIQREERLKKEQEEAERHAMSVQEWNQRLEEVRKQEKDVLISQSVPLRNYLVKYVMPTLTTALIEVCKVRPEDPIDWVAEYLFKHSSSPGTSQEEPSAVPAA